MDCRNTLIAPYRLFPTFEKAGKVEASAYIADDKLLFIDGDGHVHELQYLGRSVKPGYMTLLIRIEEDQALPEGVIELRQNGKVVGSVMLAAELDKKHPLKDGT